MQDQSIFISYATPDFERVLPFYEKLLADGYNVWMDRKKLKGGQNWDLEIKRALRHATMIILFVSANSYDRRGYVQREIQIALDQRKEKLIDDIYVIPVMLDDGVEIPDQLSGIHVIRAYEVDAESAIKDSIDEQFTRLGVETARSQGEADVRWSRTNHKDVWDGLPGYETTYQLIHLSSAVYPQISEATDLIRGWLIKGVMAQRDVKFSQESSNLNFGEPRWTRTFTWDASCSEPTIRGRVLSISYSIFTYTGGAHGNQAFRTFTFTLDPVTYVHSLHSVFNDPDEAFKIIQNEVRKELLRSEHLEEHSINHGTENWEAFSNFAVSDTGIDFLFGPYEVGAYAAGPQSASVRYEKIAHLFTTCFSSVLETTYLPKPELADPVDAAASDANG